MKMIGVSHYPRLRSGLSGWNNTTSDHIISKFLRACP